MRPLLHRLLPHLYTLGLAALLAARLVNPTSAPWAT
jgi:hypothetical protein